MSIRGLPDERPRPSVANLIGKFEQRASKRQSSLGPGGSTGSPIASPSQSRATSVVSHNTGDSSAIEAKERREWPPKNFNPGVGAASDVPISTNTNVNTNSSTSASAFSVADLRRSLEIPGLAQTESARNPVVSPPSDGQASLSASVESIAQAKQDPSNPPAISSDSGGAAAVPEEVKSDPGTQAGRGKKDSAVTTGRAPGKLIASKSANSMRGAAGTAIAAKAATTPRLSMAHPKSSSSTPAKNTVPATKPLTTQRTGNSALSASHRAKTPIAPQASTSTSSSVKASPPVRSKTPTAARAKTPTASVPTSPPKLPSSGLYAPTKASLARARNADVPPPPKYEKKVSSSTLERLMKPTAASASKARETPVSPPRAPVKLAAKTPSAAVAARGTVPTRGKASTLKPRVGLAPARMRAEREKKEKKKEQEKEGAAKAAAASVAAVSAAAATAEHVTTDDDSLKHEQPSFVSAAQEEEESLPNEEHEEHEEEQEHMEEHTDPDADAGANANEPPSDIESYDDAFASDEEGRGLQLHSARPSESGEGAVVGGEEEASFTLSDVPEPSAEATTAIIAGNAEIEELEHVDEHDAAADAHNPDLENEEHEHEQEQGQEMPAPSPSHADDLAANGNGTVTPTVSAFQTEHKQNGNNVGANVEVPQVPNTEFDSVLDMLSVKPPASPAASVTIPATAGEIPDEDEEF